MIENSYPYLSVIVPTYHDWDRLQRCIKGLQKQTYPKDRFEIIIINNDPEDKFIPFHVTDNLILLSESQPGSYAARNTGITVAKGEILAFTDSDCFPAPDWIENGVHEISRGIDRVAGKIELFFKSDKLTIAEIFEKAYAFPQEEYVKHRQTSITANLFTKANAFQKVGLFNSQLLSGGDMEWGERAHKMGLSIVYSPDVVVMHPARNRIHEIIRKNKRVIGGVYIKSYIEERKNNRWIIYALTSLLSKIVIVRKRRDMTTSLKLFAASIAFAFELHKTAYWIALKIGIATPTRE